MIFIPFRNEFIYIFLLYVVDLYMYIRGPRISFQHILMALCLSCLCGIIPLAFAEHELKCNTNTSTYFQSIPN